jgi:hypothetical protein
LQLSTDAPGTAPKRAFANPGDMDYPILRAYGWPFQPSFNQELASIGFYTDFFYGTNDGKLPKQCAAQPFVASPRGQPGSAAAIKFSGCSMALQMAQMSAAAYYDDPRRSGAWRDLFNLNQVSITKYSAFSSWTTKYHGIPHNDSARYHKHFVNGYQIPKHVKIRTSYTYH